MTKQVIVVRHDLNMRKGKIASQSAHAAMKVFFDLMQKTSDLSCNSAEVPVYYTFKATKPMEEWIDGIFTKICARVDSEEELVKLYEQAKTAGIPAALIEDHGITEFHGILTKTCIAIGPDEAEKIDKITGHLQLL